MYYEVITFVKELFLNYENCKLIVKENLIIKQEYSNLHQHKRHHYQTQYLYDVRNQNMTQISKQQQMTQIKTNIRNAYWTHCSSHHTNGNNHWDYKNISLPLTVTSDA